MLIKYEMSYTVTTFFWIVETSEFSTAFNSHSYEMIRLLAFCNLPLAQQIKFEFQLTELYKCIYEFLIGPIIECFNVVIVI